MFWYSIQYYCKEMFLFHSFAFDCLPFISKLKINHLAKSTLPSFLEEVTEVYCPMEGQSKSKLVEKSLFAIYLQDNPPLETPWRFHSTLIFGGSERAVSDGLALYTQLGNCCHCRLFTPFWQCNSMHIKPQLHLMYLIW